MKRTSFKNSNFYWILIIYLCGLLIWNLYLTINYSNLLGLLPITIQIVLLTLIFMKHEYAKIGIKIWAILVLILGSGLQFVGRLLNGLSDGFSNVDIEYYLTTGLTVIIGVILLIYTNETVEIVEVEKEESST